MAQIAALSPKEVVKARKESMPDVVIEVFNQLIAEKFNGQNAIVYQDKVIKALVAKGLKQGDIIQKGWLDVEDIYRKKGWKVEYDKPGYNESYEAYFNFSVK